MTEAEKRYEERMAYLEKRGEAYMPTLIQKLSERIIKSEREEVDISTMVAVNMENDRIFGTNY